LHQCSIWAKIDLLKLHCARNVWLGNKEKKVYKLIEEKEDNLIRYPDLLNEGEKEENISLLGSQVKVKNCKTVLKI